jgi:hypothetical protein
MLEYPPDPAIEIWHLDLLCYCLRWPDRFANLCYVDKPLVLETRQDDLLL